LTPSGQPAVQQIIIKETVKVNCRYCGSLIDSTAETCPFCGATRS
jgi:rubrerythrin